MIGTVGRDVARQPGCAAVLLRPAAARGDGPGLQPGVDTIWYTDRTSDRPTRLLQVDPDDCSLVNAWWFPGQKAGQGGGLRDRRDRCAVGGRPARRRVLLVDIKDDLITDLPWLSLSSAGGTLAPGETVSIKVSISSKGTEPGSSARTSWCRSDSGRQSKTYVPVTLTTTKYQVGVNAGGPKFTDGSGYTWSADQPASKEAWGYKGKTQGHRHEGPDRGHEDDALFQSQRTTPGKGLIYRCPDAPKGTYASTSGSPRSRR